MYLSKIKLAPRWANNPYQWHRALWQLFAGREDAERDFLFRVEKGTLGETYVLLQSAEEPATTAGDVQVLASKPFKPALAMGQALRFHLVANPIKTIRDARGRLDKQGEPKACRVPLIRAEEQQDWLRRKLSGAADLEQLQAMVQPPLYFRRKGAAGKIVPVAFDGVLIVRDPDQLHAMLQNGVGPAKSFGCGLLSLARA